jgi:hypothetical protein
MAAPRLGPRRRLNPFLLRSVDRSGKIKSRIAFAAGWPHYIHFYETLRAGTVVATPLMVERLERVADAVGFPRDEIFLDEARSA